MISARDRDWLGTAAGLAEFGRFRVEPNPLVGCVLVRGDERVGAGWHANYGGPHAEVAALRDAGSKARGSIAYVTLEPCTTSGKTGPCVEALAKAGVKRVVWAVNDPNPVHRGKAGRALRAHGIVAEGPTFRVDPQPDFTVALRRSLESDRPWVFAKWASSRDGFLAFKRGERASISGPRSWLKVHELRGRVEAVAVGVGTVLADDPGLDCRLPGGPSDARPQPAAVVFDSNLRTPIDSKLVRGATTSRPLHIYVAEPPPRRLRAFAARTGVVVTSMPNRDGRVDLPRALVHLRAQGCRRLLVEAGGELTGALFSSRLVDQFALVVAPIVVGRRDAPTVVLPADFPGQRGISASFFPSRWKSEGRPADVWIEGYVVPQSPSARRAANSARR